MQYSFSKSDFINQRKNPEKYYHIFAIKPEGFDYVKRVILDAYEAERKDVEDDVMVKIYSSIEKYLEKYCNEFNCNIVSKYGRVCRRIAYRLSNAVGKYSFIKPIM